MIRDSSDAEVSRVIKFLDTKTYGILNRKLSNGKEKCEIKESELKGCHSLSVLDIYRDLKFVLDRLGYDVKPNNGLTQTSKEVRLEGEALKRVRDAYKLYNNYS